ncbi:unnamed protein product [Orchesella dallaii]|uniref:Uncharacterized protein n=1 Tax=Orchesella dallaii TaxID=48710 RepID=A0ABP1QYZ4_9HEXA
MERDLIQRIRVTPKDKLNRYKRNAAMRLQANLLRSFQALSTNQKGVPAKVRTMAKSAVAACQAGHMTAAIVNNLPTILQQCSPQQGHPAEQLQGVLTTLIPNLPSGVKGPLQGLNNFVSTNLNGVNTLLAGTLAGPPDLLAGVIKSLTNNLGAVTETLNGSLGSVGVLLGGALG